MDCRLCQLPSTTLRHVPEDADPFRRRLIRLLEKKWVNGSLIRYHFLKTGDWPANEDECKETVRNAFQQWKDLGIGLTFEEVETAEESEIRIGFIEGEGAWSYVGRDVVGLNKSELTMNFGWDISSDPDTALHEIGHALGLPHEHQNPNAGIVWDEEAVYRAVAGPPNNWDEETAFRNIIEKVPATSVDGGEWDPDSIMHYPFGPGLIAEPIKYQAGLFPTPGLSEDDKKWILEFYPPVDEVANRVLSNLEPVFIPIKVGEQVNFTVTPVATGQGHFQTLGVNDTIMALYEENDGGPVLVKEDDDSGIDHNAQFSVPVEEGKEYTLKIRLYYAGGLGEDVGVIYWVNPRKETTGTTIIVE